VPVERRPGVEQAAAAGRAPGYDGAIMQPAQAGPDLSAAALAPQAGGMTDAPHAPVSPAEPTTESQEWDERYGSDPAGIWSGDPNGALVRQASDLRPGRVLDVGCGEGADAVWLAQRGWRVTALDVSGVALDRARAHAAAAGVSITFVHGGLLDAALPDAGFDLVSAQYPALRRTPDDRAEQALISAVAPGGTLLVVHHDLTDPEAAARHDFDARDWVGPRDVAARLGSDWRIEVDEIHERNVSGGAGAHHRRDVVLRATRTA
jgi:SAM-dependent methyltransferase